MRLLNALLFGIIIGIFGLVFWAHRALYTSTFDVTYWKDKYEHSQWKLPLSERILGDDGLYLYEGYRLMQGEDPTTLNAEVPPLGKYLIGASILVFGNGYIYGFISTTLALASLFLLSFALTANMTLSLIAVLVVSLDPLIAQQFSLTMLDSTQLLFGLLSLWLLTIVIKRRQPQVPYTLLLILGITYGLFAATKAPIFSPLLLVVIALALGIKYRSIKPFIPVVVAAGVTYMLPYAWYFRLGHSVRDWLGVQKWILSFYRGSYVSPNIGSVLTTLIINRYQNLFSRAWEFADHWTFAWPAISGLVFVELYRIIRRKKIEIRSHYPLIIFVALSLGFLSIIPFWTRYLVTVLPVVYLLALTHIPKYLERYTRWVVIGLICVNIMPFVQTVFPTPKATLEQFTSDWGHGFFQDMYEATTTDTKKSITRQEYYRLGQQILYDAQIEEGSFAIQPFRWQNFTSSERIPVHITYKTRNLGSFDEDVTIPLVKQNGQWRVSWQWDVFLKDFTPAARLETTVDPAKRGGIFALDGTPLAEDKESQLIWLLPEKIDKETEAELFETVEALFDRRIKAVHFHERYVRLGSLGKPIPLGVLMQAQNPETQTLLTRFPALMTTPSYGRFVVQTSGYEIGAVTNTLYSECCSLLYTTSSYDGRDGLEKEYNALLKGENGGSLILKDNNGKSIRTIIQKTKRDGQNVRLTQ